MAPPFLLLLLWFLTQKNAHADLIWENPPLSVIAPLAGQQTRIPFHFQNTGAAPIHIESVHTSCSCLATELSQHLIAPGAHGTLTAVVRTVGKPASRTARIELITAEAPSQPFRLEFRIQQPVEVSLEPAILWWRTGSNPTSRTALLRLPKGSTLKLPPLPPASPFKAEIHTANSAEPEIWRVEVTPRLLDAPSEWQLALEYTLPNAERTESRTLFLSVLATPTSR